jgi:type II secretory pathway pseudopilin PulG
MIKTMINTFYKKHNTRHNARRKIHQTVAGGFTLIEIMVSVSLFLVVMVVSLAAVVAIVDGNKKTQAIISVSNNLNYTIESMIRDIKTGYIYVCGDPALPLNKTTTYTPCDTAQQSKITFISRITGQDLTVQYEFKETSDGRGYIEKLFCPSSVILLSGVSGCDAAVYNSGVGVAITSPDIDIDTGVSGFYVKPGLRGVEQPGVFITLKGTAAINRTTSSDFSVQTFVSQRLLNI